MGLEDQGFEIHKDFLELKEVIYFERIIEFLYQTQALKIVPSAGEKTISEICETLELTDKEALYQVQKMIPSSLSIQFSCAKFRSVDISMPFIEGPGFFINRPNTDRLLYKWHSEEHYYPKRRRFLNLWFPLFCDKTKENGTMSFKVGSHKRKFPFAEYKGYNKDSQDKANHFIQYEIPENFLTDFEEVHVEARRGDLVVFHSGLVHRSNPNTSDKYSFAGVARLWNPADDLTLSGDFCATPYGNDIGRPGLIVGVF